MIEYCTFETISGADVMLPYGHFGIIKMANVEKTPFFQYSDGRIYASYEILYNNTNFHVSEDEGEKIIEFIKNQNDKSMMAGEQDG